MIHILAICIHITVIIMLMLIIYAVYNTYTLHYIYSMCILLHYTTLHYTLYIGVGKGQCEDRRRVQRLQDRFGSTAA